MLISQATQKDWLPELTLLTSRGMIRNLLALAIVLLTAFSGTLVTSPMPTVRACNGCIFLLKWGSFGSGPSEFNYPYALALDGSGNVYVTDFENHRVEKFTSTGAYVTAWGCTNAGAGCGSSSGPGRFDGPDGLVVDRSGNVYVADYYNNRVEKFTSSGAYITQWGSVGTGNGELYGPSGLAVDASGNVYVADYGNNRVEKFTSTGIYVTQWGCATVNSSPPACTAGSDPGAFNEPYSVAVDGSGNVYVPDYNNNRIEKFTSTGIFILQWSGSGLNALNGPSYVALDSSGNVYVTNFSSNNVEKFNDTGAFLQSWGSFGSGDGEFNEPQGVAVDSLGNVYITDLDNDRVQLFADTSTSVNIPLAVGWNLISLPLVPASTAISNVLGRLIAGHNFTVVWSYQRGVWKLFTPPTTGTLTSMVDGFGYWIYVTTPSNLYLLGSVIPPATSPPSYSLSSGWNLVGYKPQPDPTANETVSTYLTSVAGMYDSSNVWLYHGGSWVRATGSTSLMPGEGMWILMTAPATLRP